MSVIRENREPAPAESAPRTRRRVSDAVLQWVTGEVASRSSGRVVRISDPRHREAVVALLGPADTLLLPAEASLPADAPGSIDAGPRTIGYSGALDQPGDVAWFGDLRIQVEDYASIPFLPVSGATIARIRDAAGWRAYLEDADGARRGGYLVPQLLGSAVAIGGLTSRPAPDDTVASVDIDSDGVARLGPDGLILGRIDDPTALAAALTHRYPPLAGLGRIDAEVVEDVARRPWLDLYRSALAFAAPDDTGRAWAVSGLGSALHPDGDTERITRADLLLLHRDDERVLVETTTLRRFALSPETALAVECVLSTETDEAACGRLATAGIATEAGFAARLIERFAHDGVRLRMPA
ncbi:hypothetical protein HQQ80_05480 [Microbacteriaceae bacterium VKM Ac-2855]|nr:hypothetical protein [Microbacteriaceae bacterium VKM Ac-2855]